MAARAWPAAESLERDGWLLRHTPHVGRRRSNSALPLAGARTGDEAIAAVEAHYRERGSRPLVQVAPLEEHRALDAELAERGWTAGGATDVLVAPVGAVASERPGVEVADGLPAGWLEDWARAEGRGDALVHREILDAIPPPAGFARAVRGGRVAGTGLCAVGGLGGRLLPGHSGRGPPPGHRPGGAGRSRRLGRRARRLPPLPPGRGGQRRRPGAVRGSGFTRSTATTTARRPDRARPTQAGTAARRR